MTISFGNLVFCVVATEGHKQMQIIFSLCSISKKINRKTKLLYFLCMCVKGHYLVEKLPALTWTEKCICSRKNVG